MQNLSKEEFFKQRSLAEKLCDARTILNRKRFLRNESVLENVVESDLLRFKAIMDDLEESSLVSDWIIGGGTAVMYYSEVVPTIDIDVFARYAAKSFLAPLSEVYAHLVEKHNTRFEAEMVRIGSLYLQFLPADSGNPADAEAVRHPKIIQDGLRLFELEYLICSMLHVGSRKYLSRLTLIKSESRYDEAKLIGLLKTFGLEQKWESL